MSKKVILPPSSSVIAVMTFDGNVASVITEDRDEPSYISTWILLYGDDVACRVPLDA